MSERLYEMAVLVTYFASLNIHRVEQKSEIERKININNNLPLDSFSIDQSIIFITMSASNLNLRATLSDYGNDLIWIKTISCELRNFNSYGEQNRFMGEEFTVMLLCFLKELSANDGITWTNIECAEGWHSIHVDIIF